MLQQVGWRGLGGAGGAPRWRLSEAVSLTAGVTAGAASQAAVAAADVAVGSESGGLHVLLQTGAGSEQRLHVVDVEGDPTAGMPGGHLQFCTFSSWRQNRTELRVHRSPEL